MAVGKIYFYLFTALLAIHFIFAEENQENNEEKRWSITFSRLANDTRRPRSPFSFLPNISRCDYSSEPGVTCSGCSTVRICLFNNVSISSKCGFFLPYCENGRCSRSPSAICNGTSSDDSE